MASLFEAGSPNSDVEYVRNILTDLLHLDAELIKLYPGCSSNSCFQVTLRQAVLQSHSLRYPANSTQPIPAGTTQIVFRMPKIMPDLVSHVRIRNEVAALAMARDAFTKESFPLVPEVYAWSDGTEDDRQGWIVEQAMTGDPVSAIFRDLDQHQKQYILIQMATVVRLIQQAKPSALVTIGGLDLDGQGRVIGGISAQGLGGPFDTLTDLYKAMAAQQLASAEASTVLAGWHANGVRHRIDNFIQSGISRVFQSMHANTTGLSDSGRFEAVLVHGDITLDNFLVANIEGNMQITAILDFEFARISSPLEEFMSSFYDLYAFLPGPFGSREQNVLMHKALLEGFPDPLPSMVPVEPGHVQYGSGAGIDWELSRAWTTHLGDQGVRIPSNIKSAGMICAVYWLIQSLAPAHLVRTNFISQQSVDQLQVRRQEAEDCLIRYLDHFAFSN